MLLCCFLSLWSLFHAFRAVMALSWVGASPLDDFQPIGCSEEEQVCLLPLPEAGLTQSISITNVIHVIF